MQRMREQMKLIGVEGVALGSLVLFTEKNSNNMWDWGIHCLRIKKKGEVYIF